MEVTPLGHVHALDPERFLDPSITLFGARQDGSLVAVAALRHVDGGHGELKSMHTSDAFRGQGIARAMVAHMLTVAAGRNYRRVSLETGTADAFAPARSLYSKLGVRCEPFGEYTQHPESICMTIRLRAGEPAGA